ncbi:NAD-dependent epimerase/dehydratase family protein [Daejeonella oryzae]|uniref:NAD-dependent epimerase/dehydratase family protein n=1 Tax=Daejeonella oryzae TaxID=1122943 RepID=UPI000422843A|nr:NAD-dependent epimerase/dehydratase family protein [Daejeonella oryzae]
MNKKRVLITGSQGFLGRYLTSSLLAEFEDIQILGIGRSEEIPRSFTHSVHIKGNILSNAPLPDELLKLLENDKYRYLQANILDKTKIEDVMLDFNPTEIIHLASGLKGDGYGKLFSTNIQGTLNLLWACNKHFKNIPFVAISSGGIYGLPSKIEDIPFKESDICNPADLYQFAKATEETIVKSFCEQFHIPYLVLRVFNIVGPGQDERHVCGRFVSELLRIKNDPLITELQTSSLDSIRDFVDVRDVASYIALLLNRGNYNETYNICSGVPVMIDSILSECLRLIFDKKKDSFEIKTTELALLNGKIDHHLGDNSKILSTGGMIKHNIYESISDMVGYYNNLYTVCEPKSV